MLTRTKDAFIYALVVVLTAGMLAFVVGGMLLTSPAVNAATSTFSISGTTSPKAIYKGSGFVVKGTVYSKYRITGLRAGVRTADGKWVSGVNAYAKPAANKYSLSKLDSKIKFGRLSAGTYRYAVWVKNEKGISKYVLSKTFTVSYFSTSNISAPGTLNTGSGFTLRGYVKSKYNIAYMKAGIKTLSGAWKSGHYVIASPNAASYNISKINSRIKFGNLPNGTYYYKIYVRDKYGIGKYVISKKFTVRAAAKTTDSSVPAAGGKCLSYNQSVISAIGAQGPSMCAIYSMAYCRAVIDGHFYRYYYTSSGVKKSYSTYRSRIYNQYGYGSSWAYWSAANGTSTYFTTSGSCYRAALYQINKGRPCILLVHNRYSGNTHYVALIGYRAGTTASNVKISSFIALDPVYACKKYLYSIYTGGSMRYTNSSVHQLITF